jgi:hypothetical protein
MNRITRREAFKLASAAALSASASAVTVAQDQSPHTIPLWGVFEASFTAPISGNPYTDVRLSAIFTQGSRNIEVAGFCDGEEKGIARFKIRFMPDALGRWTFTLHSSLSSLDGQKGSFEAVPALPGAHGPVSVRNTFHFASADGTPFFPFGTTCYAWMHQSEDLRRQTLDTLAASPFNKVRMCLLPKSYEYNTGEPPLFPFARDAAGKHDFTRPNPEFFQMVERSIAALGERGIVADLILFHPYDSWGFAAMPPEADDFYLRYAVARLAAYSNVWWSMANEWDLMKAKSLADFDRLFKILETADPYSRLRSIHYSVTMYDYSRPWITHASLQTYDFATAPTYRANWLKPVCYDEVQYEGNLNRRWGNLSGDEMSRRFWLGIVNGCYVTHGETYLDPNDPMDEQNHHPIFWSQGGPLKGTSPKQIAFLRKLVEESAGGLPSTRTGFTPDPKPYYLNATAYAADGKTARTILYYFDYHQPSWYEFPLPEGEFTFEWIDPISMTITPQPGRHKGKVKLRLPGRPFQAARFRAV